MSRRAALVGLGGAALLAGRAGESDARAASVEMAPSRDPWLDVKRDFNAVGDGHADDTAALEAAIKSGSDTQRPVRMPPGVYPITRSLTLPPNTMLIGSSPALGFGCRLEPIGCPAFTIGGKQESFHCALENLMIWPRGDAPDFIISIDNSYSISLRNLRIHEAQSRLRCAAVLLLGDPAVGGHGRCNNIVWDNLIVRNDVDQPAVALLAARGCGSHRFILPCLENYRTLFDWRGGQIDWVLPYTERAGQYAVDCNLETADATAYFNTFGGSIDCAASGLACAIRATTRNFNSFATRWAATNANAAHLYERPAEPPTFHGIVPNVSDSGPARFSGAVGWRDWINFPQAATASSHELRLEIPARGTATAVVPVPQAAPRRHWARVDLDRDAQDAHLSAFVSGPGAVTVAARSLTGSDVTLSGVFTVTCGLV
jgi:hypothetical protein